MTQSPAVMGFDVDHRRSRPQRPGDRRPTWRKPAIACWCSSGASWSGGCAVTEEVWPGYRVSTAAYLTSLLQERIVHDLELERFGYQVDAKDPAFFSPFPTAAISSCGRTSAKTLAEIAKFSRRDAEAYPGLRRASGAAGGLRRIAAAHHAAGLPAATAWRFRRVPASWPAHGANCSRKEIVGLVKIFTQSAADFLDEWFESPEIKVTLATDGVIGANGGPRSPGTAYILLHHCMGGVGGKRGLWGFVRGGMGAVTKAMADSARQPRR